MKKHGTKTGAESPAAPATAIAWYTREEWDAVRREASDAEVFDANYDEWQANATRVLDQILGGHPKPATDRHLKTGQ